MQQEVSWLDLDLAPLIPTCNLLLLCRWAIVPRNSSILETNNISWGNPNIFEGFIVDFVEDVRTI